MTERIDLRAACDRIRAGNPLSAIASRAGVKLQRAGNEWKACCPFHADRTPSFTIYSGDRRAHCFGCGWGGDVLDFVQAAYRVSLIEAVRMLDSEALGPITTPAAPAKPKADLSALVARIWRDAKPIEGTPAERYLRNRAITMELPDCLRFARLVPPAIDGNGLVAANGTGPLPALVALVTGPDGAIAGLQRTYLTEDGRKAAVTPTEADRKPKVKYSLGTVRGGAIRLGPAAPSILIAEGLEDSLSLAQALGRPVWAAAGTSNLPHIALPDVVRAIVIGADGDAAGEAAALKAAEAYTATGRAVRILRPSKGFKDHNQEAMEGRA